MPRFRIVEGALPSERALVASQTPPQPLYDGSLWWFEHMAGQMSRSAAIQTQLEDDRRKAKEESLALYGRIVSGELARELQERHAESGDGSVTPPDTEELLLAYQRHLLGERLAFNIIDGAIASNDRERLKSLKFNPVFTQLSEKIQPSAQDQSSTKQKSNYDVTTLWANLLARSMTILGKPSAVARQAQRTAQAGQLLGDNLLDVAVRKAARNLAATLTLPAADLEHDLVRIVRESSEYHQNYASVIRLLRDMTDDPWTLCAACEHRNETPWDECTECGAERGDNQKKWIRCVACGRKNAIRMKVCGDKECPTNRPS